MHLIFLDTEVTGITPAQGRIVEIACVEMRDNQLTGRELHHYINPQHSISDEISNIIKIHDAMVAGKPKFSNIAQEFIDFLGARKIVTHGAYFEKYFFPGNFATLE